MKITVSGHGLVWIPGLGLRVLKGDLPPHFRAQGYSANRLLVGIPEVTIWLMRVIKRPYYRSPRPPKHSVEIQL